VKAKSCRKCKGKGQFVLKQGIFTCEKIVEHYEESVRLLNEVVNIYGRTIAHGKERSFATEMRAFIKRNGIDKGRV
jgi:hypothetical protein